MKIIITLTLVLSIIGCGLETAYRTHPEHQQAEKEKACKQSSGC